MYKTQILAHEFGHVLGLQHSEESCSLMSKSRVCPRLVADRPEGYYSLCGPLQVDIEQLPGASLSKSEQWCLTDRPEDAESGFPVRSYNQARTMLSSLGDKPFRADLYEIGDMLDERELAMSNTVPLPMISTLIMEDITDSGELPTLADWGLSYPGRPER